MPNYKNGRIYKICNNVNNLIYIGSTTLPLSKRMAVHRTYSKNKYYKDMKLYKYIHELGIHNFSIILIENYPCCNKEQLLQRERFYFDLYNKDNILLNSNRPIVSSIEKKHDTNKYYKLWYNNNREYKKKQVMNRYLKYRSYLITYQQKYNEYQKIMQELHFYRVPLTTSF